MKEHLSFRHQTRFVVQVDCSVDCLTDTAGTVWSSVILGAYTLPQFGVEIWKCALVFPELLVKFVRYECLRVQPAGWPLCRLVGRLSERRISSRSVIVRIPAVQSFTSTFFSSCYSEALAYSHLTMWVVCSHAWFRFLSSILKSFLICPQYWVFYSSSRLSLRGTTSRLFSTKDSLLFEQNSEGLLRAKVQILLCWLFSDCISSHGNLVKMTAKAL